MGVDSRLRAETKPIEKFLEEELEPLKAMILQLRPTCTVRSKSVNVHLAAAQNLIEGGDYDGAEAALRRAAEQIRASIRPFFYRVTDLVAQEIHTAHGDHCFDQDIHEQLKKQLRTWDEWLGRQPLVKPLNLEAAVANYLQLKRALPVAIETQLGRTAERKRKERETQNRIAGRIRELTATLAF